MKKIITLILLLTLTIGLNAQRASIDLTFTAQSGSQNVQLDSVKVINIDQGGDATLYWPDTVLTLFYTGVGVNNNQSDKPASLILQQESSTGIIDITANNYESNQMKLIINDLMGRSLSTLDLNQGKGIYHLKLSPGNDNFYLICLSSENYTVCSKAVSVNRNFSSNCKLILDSYSPELLMHKASIVTSFPFTPGDSLSFVGYYNSNSVVIHDNPSTSETYAFQFPAQSPCQGITSFIYGGQTYNTVEIGTQCWMKENLNIGTMVAVAMNQSNDSIIEKYCYNDDSAKCAEYGGLYQWNEMMQYSTIPGTQGICATGWHIQTDAEWTTLTTFLGGTSVAGGKMKETGFLHWYSPNTGASNMSGFTGLGGGYSYWGVGFGYLGDGAEFWCSSQYNTDYVWYLSLYRYGANVCQNYNDKSFGFSVSCVRP